MRQRGSDGRRWQIGADDDPHVRKRWQFLRDRQIGDRQEHRARLVGRESHGRESALLPYLEEFRVSDEPDDVVGGLWRARHIQLERLPDRIAVLEVPLREGLVHDGGSRGLGQVAMVERPACEKGCLHGAEVVAVDRVEVHVAVLHHTAFDDLSVPVSATERYDRCFGGVTNAWDGMEPRDDVGECLPPRPGLHGGSAQIDRCHHDVRIEAEFDRGEVPERTPEEQRTDHEHH